VHFAFSARRGGLASILERLHAAGASPRGPVEHAGGDHSIHVEDPEGNVVEVWDYFEDGDGRVAGVAGLEP
jgi:catechol-2,3-dioxygenase